MLIWEANKEVLDLVESTKKKYHNNRLREALVAVSFTDAKAFIRDRFNWGKTSKFSPRYRLWHSKDKQYDFHISLPGDSWLGILDGQQREAWLDLHLTRCSVDYVPVTIEKNGKKEVVKDEWGRVQYTDVMKYDQEGRPKWRVLDLDLNVFADNVSRFGLWCSDLTEFSDVVKNKC